MTKVLVVLALLAAGALAGQVPAEATGGSGGGVDLECLQYDDGIPQSFVWGNAGVLFNTQDFEPTSIGFNLSTAEYWFYEHASYPWDTDSFYSEIWTGDELGPISLMAQGFVTALHNAPCYHSISPTLITDVEFWCIANTGMSSGGWPSMLVDASGDFLLRAHGEFIYDFSMKSVTWAAVKALF